MHLRPVRKIDLQTKWCDTSSVSCFAIEHRHTTDRRTADDGSSCKRDGNCVQRVLKRETVIRGKRATITKRRDHKLSIFGFVVAQAAKDRRRFRRKTAPEAKLIVTSFQKKRIIFLGEC